MSATEQRVKGAQHFCAHYNGLIGTIGQPSMTDGRTCGAGVEYRSVVDPERTGLDRLPCFAASGARTCERRHIRSDEEAAAFVAEAQAREDAIPVDPIAGCKYETTAEGERVALVMQMGYRCLHAELVPPQEKLREAGFKRYRVRMFADASGPCPACRAKGR